MYTKKNTSYTLVLFVTMIFFTVTSTVFANHEAIVAEEVVSSSDPNIGSGPNCAGLHYQGVLNGKSDPDPERCGHGIITILEHDNNDKSIVPEPKKKIAILASGKKLGDGLEMRLMLLHKCLAHHLQKLSPTQ